MEVEHEKKDGLAAWAAWSVAVTFFFYKGIICTAPSVMKQEITQSFSVSTAAFGFAIAAFLYVYSPMQLIVGTLFDRFGSKLVLIPAALFISVGCFLPTIPSQSLWWLATGRVMMGFGASFGFTGTVYVASRCFSSNKLSLLSCMATAVGLIGLTIGQAPIKCLVERYDWRTTFQSLAVAGILVAALIFFFLPNDGKGRSDRDSKTCNTSFRDVINGLISVLKNKQTWLIGTIGGCLYMPTEVFGGLWGVQYLKGALGITEMEAAKINSALFWGWIIGGPIAGMIDAKIGCRKKMLIFGGILGTLLFSALLVIQPSSPALTAMLLFFAGVVSSPQSMVFAANLEANDKRASGSAVAVTNMIVMTLCAVFQPLVGLFVDDQSNTIDSFRNALMSMPILTLAGAVLAVFIKEAKKKVD